MAKPIYGKDKQARIEIRMSVEDKAKVKTWADSRGQSVAEAILNVLADELSNDKTKMTADTLKRLKTTGNRLVDECITRQMQMADVAKKNLLPVAMDLHTLLQELENKG